MPLWSYDFQSLVTTFPESTNLVWWKIEQAQPNRFCWDWFWQTKMFFGFNWTYQWNSLFEVYVLIAYRQNSQIWNWIGCYYIQFSMILGNISLLIKKRIWRLKIELKMFEQHLLISNQDPTVVDEITWNFHQKLIKDSFRLSILIKMIH